MPLSNSPPFTALDVQAQMIAYLNADPYIQAAILTQAEAFNPVLDDDPTPGTIDETSNMRLILTLAAEGEEDATMGGVGAGTADVINGFSAMLYVYEGPNRTPEAKRTMVQATGIVRQALMRYRQGTGVPAGGSQPAQLWWTSRFRKHRDDYATVYETPKNCRLSVTLIDLISRYPYS